ncbi:hypothetical protein KIF59_17480 [Enterobacter cloacae subsp. cloacae]|nr:hypothetical protein [Enterobacter cloacae subsp. cloacae]
MDVIPLRRYFYRCRHGSERNTSHVLQQQQTGSASATRLKIRRWSVLSTTVQWPS